MNFEQNCIVDLRKFCLWMCRNATDSAKEIVLFNQLSHHIGQTEQVCHKRNPAQLVTEMRSEIAWMSCCSLLQESHEEWEPQCQYQQLAVIIPERDCLTMQEHPSLSLFICAYFKLQHLVNLGNTNKQIMQKFKMSLFFKLQA